MQNRISYPITPVLLFIFSLSGCAGYHSKVYSGKKLPDSEVSTITTDNRKITISGIDGDKTIKLSNPSNFLNVALTGKFPRTITVLPGKHALMPCYEDGFRRGYAENWLHVEAEAGETYIIKHKEHQKDPLVLEFWIEKNK